ncbi:hypothetical protein Dimus_020895 [Dionaea muscipula]
MKIVISDYILEGAPRCVSSVTMTRWVRLRLHLIQRGERQREEKDRERAATASNKKTNGGDGRRRQRGHHRKIDTDTGSRSSSSPIGGLLPETAPGCQFFAMGCSSTSNQVI